MNFQCLFFTKAFTQKYKEQAVAELGHTRIPSCQLGQCSDQVEPDRVGMVLVREGFKNKRKISGIFH